MLFKHTLTIKNKLKTPAFTLAAIALLSSQGVSADITESIENALKFGQKDAKYGQIKVDIRYRYENVNTVQTMTQTANADTIRMRLGYLSPEFSGLQGFVEYETNQDIFTNDYNSTRNGKTQFDKIVDPQQHELNRFWFTYSGIPDTIVKVGRQRIKIDNTRFIGNVGWRQLEQTYDAILLTNKSLPNTTVKAGYIINTRDIFSKENDMDTQFVNIGYDINNIGKLSAYTYLIDFQADPGKNANSNQTYGVRFNGSYEICENFEALYTAEYALQKDFEDNPNDYEVDYFHVMGGVTAHGITLKGAMEQLGGNNGKGFDTPLATKHGFQGWADIFLATPGTGIRDTHVTLSGKVMDVKIIGVYHDFNDDTGKTDLGEEYDFIVIKKFGKHYSLLAKYAYYDAETFKTDTQKFWLEGGISF